MFSNWSPGFVTGIVTLSWIVLLALLVGIELVSSSTRVTSVKSAKGVGLSELETTGPIDRTPGHLGPIRDRHFLQEGVTNLS